MNYVIFCTDSDNSDELRVTHRDDHLAHIKSISGKLMLAGPCPADGDQAGASMVIVEADSADDARGIIESDPYFKGGVWSDVMVRQYNAVAGAWAPKS